MNRTDYLDYLDATRHQCAKDEGNLSHWNWSIAVFSSRERPKELENTLIGVIEAAGSSVVIDVLINGSDRLALLTAESTRLADAVQERDCMLRVWHIPLANKSHAWNLYVHAIAPKADHYLCIDGYVSVNAESLRKIESLSASNEQALAFSGVPIVGRTSEQMRSVYEAEGGIHGNFFALTSPCVERIRQVGAILPIGLYGFDTVLGGMLGFGLEPSLRSWDIKRYVLSDPMLHWSVPVKAPYRWRDVKIQLKRIRNNALRKLVRKATIHYLEHKRRPLNELGVTIDSYLHEWRDDRKREFWILVLRSPLSWLEFRELKGRYSIKEALEKPRIVRKINSVRAKREGP